MLPSVYKYSNCELKQKGHFVGLDKDLSLDKTRTKDLNQKGPKRLGGEDEARRLWCRLTAASVGLTPPKRTLEDPRVADKGKVLRKNKRREAEPEQTQVVRLRQRTHKRTRTDFAKSWSALITILPQLRVASPPLNPSLNPRKICLIVGTLQPPACILPAFPRILACRVLSAVWNLGED